MMKKKINLDFYLHWVRIITVKFSIALLVLVGVLTFIKVIKSVSQKQEVLVTTKNKDNEEEFITIKRFVKPENGEEQDKPENEDEEVQQDNLINFIPRLLFEIENIEHLIAIITLIVFTWDVPSQRKRTNLEAWQVINSAQGQGGSGGRVKALEYLNKQQESMAGLTAFDADLTGVNLRKADLFRANLRNTCLNNSDLKGSDLREAKLNDSRLRNANLRKADLSRADLENAKLESADLSNTKLNAANLSYADLIDAKLENADLSNANLNNADLRNANLCCVELNRTQLTQANLCRTDLRKSQLIGTNLEDTNLWRSNLSNAHLHNADFSRANLSLTDLTNADFKNTILNNADLAHANLRYAQNLTVEQVQAANNWDTAYYDPEFCKRLGLC